MIYTQALNSQGRFINHIEVEDDDILYFNFNDLSDKSQVEDAPRSVRP